MAPLTVNVLLSTFPGLNLPPTLCIPFLSTKSLADLANHITLLLPASLNTDCLTLCGHKSVPLPQSSTQTIGSLLGPSTPSCTGTPSLSLRLTHPLKGGKGGFGSQLRAAGGRMSSRKRRNNGTFAPNSNRNLDGRRLRTVGEAKALAEYLAVKPEMDKKEKEERRKRWEAVVESSERKREEIESGKGGRVKGDGAWLEEKEEVENKVREQIKLAMERGEGLPADSDESMDGSGGSAASSGTDAIVDMKGKGKQKAILPKIIQAVQPQHNTKKIFGWDDDNDNMSDSSVSSV